MALKAAPRPEVKMVDKASFLRALAEQDARSGFIADADASPEKVRAMMLADGVRPEENEFSREIVRMRYEE